MVTAAVVVTVVPLVVVPLSPSPARRRCRPSCPTRHPRRRVNAEQGGGGGGVVVRAYMHAAVRGVGRSSGVGGDGRRRAEEEVVVVVVCYVSVGCEYQGK